MVTNLPNTFKDHHIVIELQDVSISFDDETILKKVNLQVKSGEIFIIIGPSGGGKTVLLKLMAGVFKPTEGHVYCEGEEWINLKTEKRRELAKHIGVQFQKNALFDSLTAEENIAFPLKEHTKLDDEEIQTRVKDCLLAVNLTNVGEKLPHDLSGGMRQRLSIARAIALNPEIIFYDDPTAGLDPINTDLMGDLILNLKQQNNTTVIIATHSMDLAYKLSSEHGRIAFVADQEVIITGTKKETQESKDPRVQQFINGRLDGPLTF